MRTISRAATLFCILFIATSPSRPVLAHSHLADPLPTRQLHCRVGGDARACHGPCPVPDDYGRLNPVNKNQPAEVWGRGATVNVRWHRDNHDGTGFVRLTLVPIDQMMDKEAHDKFAFQFLCMNAGPHKCKDRSYDTCGNDFEGMAWQAPVRVPTSYPDGVYAFGWSWYGGGNYLDRTFFGDYYSCSYIEIRGGLPITPEYQPVFDGTMCRSGTDRLGLCWREPCHFGPMKDMIPMEFNGRSPEPIKSEWIPVENHDSHESGTSLSLSSGTFSSAGDSPGSSIGFGSGGGSSVSLGARSGGEEPRLQESENDEGPATFNIEGEQSSGGSLGVYFLDFQDWSKKRITSGSYYRLSDFPRGFTVEAFYNGDIKHMDFYVDGNKINRETTGPFVMNGNKGRLIHGWNVPLGKMVMLQVFVEAGKGHSDRFEATFQFN